MDLKDIITESRKMLSMFVDEIGLNGEFYSKLNKTHIVWGKPKLGGLGEYLSPGSERLVGILQFYKCDDKIKEMLNEKGIIIISQEYKQKEPDADLYVTLIHETLHAKRDLLVFDVFRENRNESAYSYNNNKIEINMSTYSAKHADISQEILKGSIDDSHNIKKSYATKTSREIEDMEWAEGKFDEQMERQQIVDEALIELMSILSYKLYSYRQRGKEFNIWNEINKVCEVYDGEDVGIMCEILLRHQDFELFNWIIDPISYSCDDIHYDFFSNYTKEDKDLVDKLYDATLDMDEYLGIEAQNFKNDEYER